MIQLLHNLALFCVKSANFWRKYFFLIITPAPVFQKAEALRLLFISPAGMKTLFKNKDLPRGPQKANSTQSRPLLYICRSPIRVSSANFYNAGVVNHGRRTCSWSPCWRGSPGRILRRRRWRWRRWRRWRGGSTSGVPIAGIDVFFIFRRKKVVIKNRPFLLKMYIPSYRYIPKIYHSSKSDIVLLH
jgi:hypothetical protein